MKSSIIITLAIFGILLLAGAAIAKQHHQDGKNHSARMMERISEQLNLNEQQQTKLSQFSDKWQAMRKEKRGGRKEGRQELMSLLDSATLDRDKALTLLDERHQTFKHHMQGMVDSFAEFSDSLDATQREGLKEIFAKRMKRHKGGPRWAK